MTYKRILLKLSGEALMGNRNYGIDPDRLSDYASQSSKLPNKVLNWQLLLEVETFLEELPVRVMEWTVFRVIIWEC